MKKLLTLIMLLSSIGLLNAQVPPPGANQKFTTDITGRIYGKIMDAGGKPLAGASLLLLKTTRDSATQKTAGTFLKAMATKANGDFEFVDLPVAAPLELQVTATGFAAYTMNISLMPAKPGAGMPSFEKDLGNISLNPDAKQLETVTVTSNVATIKLSGEKKIFNVEKNIMSAGGTGVDVMRNVPSLNVDLDGNITLRNSAPQLMVDGRPTTLTLDQIPADAIESVEVITNPSAKYDASGGGAGILNIVLKKNKKIGYNGNLRAGIDKWGATNSGFDINLRQSKFNFNASINVNENKSRTTGTTNRLTLLDNPQTAVFQNNFNQTNGAFVFGKAGIDFFATNRSTFSLSGIRVHGSFNPYETMDIVTDSLYNTGKTSYGSQRITTGNRTFDGKGLVFGFKQLFPKAGEELTIDANYFGGKSSNQSDFTTNYASNSGSTPLLESALGEGTDKNIVLQTDYILPLSKLTKFETGVRLALRSRVNNNSNYTYDNNTGEYIIIPAASTNYSNTDNVYAAYTSLSSSINNFSYQLGLRAESSTYNGELVNTGEKFSNKYPISLFPSVFLSQHFANKQDLQLSYTRRINRPNFFQLIPFTDYTDKLNITRGNPALRPEFTQSLELSYLKTLAGNSSFLGSVYYKHTTNLITRFLVQEPNPVTGTTDLINTYINANSSYATGVELTEQQFINKWWDISTNVNIYNSKINTEEASSAASQDAMWSWFGKFNSNFKLPANFAIQFTATYQSKTNLPVNTNSGMGAPGMMQSQSASQGYIEPVWGMDLAIKKSFLKNNAAAVSLSINDIFKTRTTTQYSTSDYFIQEYSRLRDPQMFRLNLSYRFGKIDASLFKRKSTKGEQNATENML